MKTKKSPSERDPAELELATMRQCLKLIRRLSLDGRQRAVAYLQSAALREEAQGPDARQESLSLS